MIRPGIVHGLDRAIDFATLQAGPVFQTHPPVFIDPSSIVLLPGVYLELDDGTHVLEENA